MAETTPLVSVVLTTFNRSRLLSRSIDSVLAQTFTDFQLIVVDDCSTDDTQQVLAGIDDTRLSVIRHERNRGLSEARNSGVRAAAGTFVAFHDDDDEWLPQKLAVEVAALSGQPDPGHVCLYSQVLVDDGISADVRPRRGLRPGEPLCEYLMCGVGLLHPITVMIPRRLLLETPFPSQGLSRYEDQNVWLALERQGVRFVLVPEPLAVWHADLRRTRMTTTNQFLEQGTAWLDQFGPQVTLKARRGFLAREIAPYLGEGKRLVALRTIAIAIFTGAVPLSVGLRNLAKAVLPPSAVISLRHVFPRSRFG
jgi:hypothetical protein